MIKNDEDKKKWEDSLVNININTKIGDLIPFGYELVKNHQNYLEECDAVLYLPSLRLRAKKRNHTSYDIPEEKIYEKNETLIDLDKSNVDVISYFSTKDHIRNGIACPVCGNELQDEYYVVGSKMKIRSKVISCTNCSYSVLRTN